MAGVAHQFFIRKAFPKMVNTRWVGYNTTRLVLLGEDRFGRAEK
jgi:hypothetical protein